MKNAIIIFLLILASNSSYGQWYVNKYKVTNINMLTKEQLDESLKASKKNLLVSGIVAGMGGCIFLVSIYGTWTPVEDPTLLEQILGDKGMNAIATATGVALLAGGTIAAAVFLGRTAQIKYVLHKNYPSTGSLNISPTLVYGKYSASPGLGVSLTYNF